MSFIDISSNIDLLYIAEYGEYLSDVFFTQKVIGGIEGLEKFLEERISCLPF